MELDAADNPMDIEKKYIYAHGQVLAQHDIAPQQDDMYFYLHDRLGSVRQIIEYDDHADDVDVVKYYAYEPFGEVIDSAGSFDNAFMFTGQYFDSEIEEYYLRARQYNPHIGRFTSRDPVHGKLQKPLTLHVYLYCLNDPINGTDPEGRYAFNLVNPILTGSALYVHSIDLAAYAASSGNWEFFDLAYVTRMFMFPAMSIAAITPTPALSWLYIGYTGRGDFAGVTIEEAFHRTGMSCPEGLAMDPAAFFLYSGVMFTAEVILDITGADMRDFARWHGPW